MRFPGTSMTDGVWGWRSVWQVRGEGLGEQKKQTEVNLRWQLWQQGPMGARRGGSKVPSLGEWCKGYWRTGGLGVGDESSPGCVGFGVPTVCLRANFSSHPFTFSPHLAVPMDTSMLARIVGGRERWQAGLFDIADYSGGSLDSHTCPWTPRTALWSLECVDINVFAPRNWTKRNMHLPWAKFLPCAEENSRYPSHWYWVWVILLWDIVKNLQYFQASKKGQRKLSAFSHCPALWPPPRTQAMRPGPAAAPVGGMIKEGRKITGLWEPSVPPNN